MSAVAALLLAAVLSHAQRTGVVVPEAPAVPQVGPAAPLELPPLSLVPDAPVVDAADGPRLAPLQSLEAPRSQPRPRAVQSQRHQARRLGAKLGLDNLDLRPALVPAWTSRPDSNVEKHVWSLSFMVLGDPALLASLESDGRRRVDLEAAGAEPGPPSIEQARALLARLEGLHGPVFDADSKEALVRALVTRRADTAERIYGFPAKEYFERFLPVAGSSKERLLSPLEVFEHQAAARSQARFLAKVAGLAEREARQRRPDAPKPVVNLSVRAGRSLDTRHEFQGGAHRVVIVSDRLLDERGASNVERFLVLRIVSYLIP